MAEEIAGLYVSIGADLSDLQIGLEETYGLLEGISMGNLEQMTQQIPAQFQQMVAGLQGALVPLPGILTNNLRIPMESSLNALLAAVQQRGEEIINQLYSIAARINTVAGQLGIPSPINTGALEGRASGGPVMSGQPYLVGEAGPELFVPGTSGAIIPNHALGGDSGFSIQGGTFHIYGVQDVESLYDQLQQVARQRG